MDDETRKILDNQAQMIALMTQQASNMTTMVERLNKTVYFGNGAPPLTTSVANMQADITEIKEWLANGNRRSSDRIWGLVAPLISGAILAIVILIVQHGLVK